MILKIIEGLKEATWTIYTMCSNISLNQKLAQVSTPKNNVIKSNKIKTKLKKDNLSIVSWNLFRNYDKKNISKSFRTIIKKYDPDIILTQEDTKQKYFFYKSFNHFFAPFHQIRKKFQNKKLYNYSVSGQRIFSKYSFSKTSVFELPYTTRYVIPNHVLQRIVVYAQIKINQKSIGIYNIHLENACGSNGRASQMKEILKIINKNKDQIIFLGGDFNTWLGSFEECTKLLKQNNFKDVLKPQLIPGLDRFFTKNCKGASIRLRFPGSDHKPIYCKIHF
ncbi:hypothetical protein HN587_02560 [Candidatus Woesearchaeota archaeon]|jgi:endonuclease/exonuclease/phosphatase family metal-dependent hydrolase|nr:hypothetical protein [Candidatus Woesearchaeota archaeon]